MRTHVTQLWYKRRYTKKKSRKKSCTDSEHVILSRREIMRFFIHDDYNTIMKRTQSVER